MKTIVLGLDGVTDSVRALERATALAEAFDSKLIVVVAEPVAPLVPLTTLEDSALAAPVVMPEQTWSRELVIEEARGFLDARKLGYEIVSPIGEAGPEIVAVADEHQAELIVVPAAHAGFFERWFVGTISDSVVRSAHRDVLLVADDPTEH